MTPHIIASEAAKRIEDRRAYVLNVANVRGIEEREMVLRLITAMPGAVIEFKLKAKNA